MIQVDVKDTGTWQKTLHITVPVERVEKEYADAVNRLRRELKIPGFRPGKAPQSLIRARFGSTIQSDLVNQLVPKAIEEAVKEAELDPIGDPKIEDLKFKPNEPMSFQVTMEIWPEIEVKGIDEIELEQEIPQTTAEQIEAALAEIRESRADLVPAERQSIKGDILKADLEPVDVHGQRMAKMERQEIQMEVGGENLLKEFKEASVGLSAGEERFIEVEYPKDYSEESLRGQKRRYRLLAKEIQEKKLKPLDDDFAREVDPGLDLAGLREKIRERLEADAEARSQARLEESLMDRLIQLNPLPLTPGMVQRGLDSVRERSEKEGRPISSEDVEGRVRPMVERTQRRQILLTSVAKCEGIKVTEEDLNERLEALVRQTGIPLAKLRSSILKSEDLVRMQDNIMERKTIDFLLKKIKVHQFVQNEQKGEKRSKGGIILP